MAADNPMTRAPMSPGPAVTAMPSSSARSMPAVAHAACSTGTIDSRWARDATSGTTPPNLTCCSMEEATSLANSSVPRTMPTPVSSHDDSIPRMSGSDMILLMCVRAGLPGLM